VSKSQVDKLDVAGRMELGDKLVSHAKGPMFDAEEYKRYVVNGVVYRTVDVDKEKKSQNSGVCVTTEDGPTYYGKLTRIIEVTYYDLTRYVLFKCDWADIQPNKGYKKDEYGFDLLNFNNLIHTGARITDDPFVLPSQISQVYYVQDPIHPNWNVAVKTKPRNVYDVGEGESSDYAEADSYHEHEPFNVNVTGDVGIDFGNDDIDCARTNVPATEAILQLYVENMHD
jgi:hypothetical protein